MYGCIYIYIYMYVYTYIYFFYGSCIGMTLCIWLLLFSLIVCQLLRLGGLGWCVLVWVGSAWFCLVWLGSMTNQSNPKQPKASQSNPKHCITGDDRWIWVMIDGGGQQWHRATGTGHKAPGDSGPRNQFPTYTEHRAYRNLGLCLAFCFKCSSSTTLWALISSLLQVWCCRMMRTLPPPLPTSWGSRLHHHQHQWQWQTPCVGKILGWRLGEDWPHRRFRQRFLKIRAIVWPRAGCLARPLRASWTRDLARWSKRQKI